MSTTRLQELFGYYYTKTISAEQKAEMMQLINESSAHELAALITSSGESLSEFEVILPAERTEAILQYILKGQVGKEEVVTRESRVVSLKGRIQLWKKIAVAASVLFIISIGSYLLFFNKSSNQTETAQHPVATDLLPGKEGAILTLADGTVIILDSIVNGKVSDDAEKNGNLLSYENAANTTVEYNTMTTPKGRQYSLLLADGSKVWLNAASSITFPTTFTGNERKVEITGEAYFEVAHNAGKPFIVSVNGMNVEVLGTHFNVNAYTDEATIKTTLLEGSVKVTKNGKEQILAPGQQANLDSNAEFTLIKDADTEEAMAWRNGNFYFKNVDITTVMRQLSRWYDMEVYYQGKVPDLKFNGEIGRTLTLKEVLEGLAFTNVRFRIEEGRKLIILP